MEMLVIYRSGWKEKASTETVQAFVETFYRYTGDPRVERIDVEFEGSRFAAFTHDDGVLRHLWPEEFADAVEDTLAGSSDAGSEEEPIDVDEGFEHLQQTLPGLQEPVEVRDRVTEAGVAPARSLPAFLHREPANTVQDFLWCRHTRLYLAHCRKACRLTRKELLPICGLANLNKLDRFREGWHDLLRPIPRSYLQALEVDLGLLQDIVELDRQEFGQALARPRYPKSLVVNLLPAAYHNRPFPPGTLEEDAVEVLSRTAKATQRIAWIHYPDLLTITAGRDGRVSRKEYWPELRVTPRQVAFGDRGFGLGTVSVGGRRY